MSLINIAKKNLKTINKDTIQRVYPYLSCELASIALIVFLSIFAGGIISTTPLMQQMEVFNAKSANVEEEIIHPSFDVTTQNTTTTIEYNTNQMCFIGDSRVVAMNQALVSDVHFIAKSSMGLDWFKNEAMPSFEKIKDKISLCVVALGVNDLHNAQQYVETLNEFANKYPNKSFVFLNIGPIDEQKYKGFKNDKIEEFNKVLTNLNPRWQVIDQYAHLKQVGFSSEDGLHYSQQDSMNLYAWVVNQVKNQEIPQEETKGE